MLRRYVSDCGSQLHSNFLSCFHEVLFRRGELASIDGIQLLKNEHFRIIYSGRHPKGLEFLCSLTLLDDLFAGFPMRFILGPTATILQLWGRGLWGSDASYTSVKRFLRRLSQLLDCLVKLSDQRWGEGYKTYLHQGCTAVGINKLGCCIHNC